MTHSLLLSYDLEEFDMPFEYNGHLPFEEQVAISTEGLLHLEEVLDKYQVQATFYCTAQYALARPEVIQRLYGKGHEIASHAFYHSRFSTPDLAASRKVLENIIQQRVHGFRMPRMMPVETTALKLAGYTYNSSLHPTWLPGRYNHFSAPQTWYNEGGLYQLPASVTPLLRIPLFWLGLHNYPLWFYKYCCKQAMQKHRYLNLYFHPWEFTDYGQAGQAQFPAYVTRNSGKAMQQRTEALIRFAIKNKYLFHTTYDWLQTVKQTEE